MRIFLIIFIVVILVVSGFMAIYFYQEADIARKNLTQERYLRIVAEENLQKVTTKVDSMATELERAKSKVGEVEQILEQSKISNDILKQRLQDAQKTQ